MVYYKSDFHEEQTQLLLDKFNLATITQDVEYGALAYVVGATYKATHVLKTIDEYNTIDTDKLHEAMGVFSSSERNMIRFALQLFNGGMDDINLSDVIYSLDSENIKVIKQAIDIRY